MKHKKLFVQLALLLVFVSLITVTVVKADAIRDWYKLRGYTPQPAIAQLADETTMTESARRIFYINRPQVESAKDFSLECKAGQEQTIVIGCYHSGDGGIFIYNVTDQRLAGIQQVTAAHEMLHAAYKRLPANEKSSVNSQLEAYFKTVKDQRLIDTISAYRKTEPNDVVNEMHSIFGTEVANLPAPLEQYYKQYFSNRQAVTTFAANYQAAFSSRKQQVEADDAQLSAWKQQIQVLQTTTGQQSADIDADRMRLEALQHDGQNDAYNRGVPDFNAKIDSYNANISALKKLVSDYNDLVVQRNTLALEENQLVQAIDSNAIPTTK